MLRASLFAFLAASTLTLGCDTEPVDDELDLESVQLRASAQEEAGLVAFLADYEVSTEEVLDIDCAIRSDSAMHIDRYRTGQDQTYGTADDQVIDSEATLDSIHMVGPWTIGQLYTCAEDFGYIAPSCGMTGNWWQTYGSGDDWETELPQPIIDEIEAYWGASYLCNVLYASSEGATMDEVRVSYSDCDVVSYRVTWLHVVDPGVQEIKINYYDADFDLYDGSCDLGPT